MKRVFLYLYPIQEYIKFFMFRKDSYYDEMNIKRPLPILNETIDKRYRNLGYEIVYAIYPDKEIFGIDIKDTDRIIYTDVTFEEASAIDSKGNEKKNFVPKYPSEEYLLNQLGDVDELVVGGFHCFDCVKKVANVSNDLGIPTTVDIELTDLFFNLYKEDYFEIDNYDPNRFKDFMINKLGPKGIEFKTRLFERNYSDPIYGFNKKETKKL